MADEKGQDEKILCVPLRDPLWSDVHELDELPGSLRAEVDQFFSLYKQLEGKKTDVGGFGDRAEAVRVIAEARARLMESREASEEVSEAVRGAQG
jgi:inorganic pyrophosphatase